MKNDSDEANVSGSAGAFADLGHGAARQSRPMSSSEKPSRGPVQAKTRRAILTRERLLDTASLLLRDVGVERISTNLIAAEAGLTPPSFYRYFKDKYDVLAALGLRLMERQNVAVEAWLEEYGPQGVAAMRDALEVLLRRIAEVTASEQGAIWIFRALRAVPQLIHIRIESHRYVADRITDVLAQHLPDYDRDDLWARVRLCIELGFAVDEMLTEEKRVSRDAVFLRAAELLAHVL